MPASLYVCMSVSSCFSVSLDLLILFLTLFTSVCMNVYLSVCLCVCTYIHPILVLFFILSHFLLSCHLFSYQFPSSLLLTLFFSGVSLYNEFSNFFPSIFSSLISLFIFLSFTFPNSQPPILFLFYSFTFTVLRTLSFFTSFPPCASLSSYLLVYLFFTYFSPFLSTFNSVASLPFSHSLLPPLPTSLRPLTFHYSVSPSHFSPHSLNPNPTVPSKRH